MLLDYDKIDIAYRDYEDFIIIYNFRTKEIMKLENVAADIWRIISTHTTTDIDQIVTNIATIYDCKISDIYQDIIDFTDELYNDGVVRKNGCYLEIKSHNDETKSVENSEDYEGEIIKEMQSREQLYSVTFEMTYACNERCVHCYANYPKDSDSSKSIGIDKYHKIIDELYEMKCFHLAFTGGDPFMYKNFYNVFEYARNKGFVCDIYTNAQYLSDNGDIMRKILKLRPRVFYISLYGATPYVHDGVTMTPHSFEKTINAIKVIKAYDIPVVLNVMLLSKNYSSYKKIVALAKRLGVEYRFGMSIIYKNDGNSNPMNYFINNKDKIKEIMQFVKKDMYSIDVPLDEIKQGDRICNAGSTALSISPDGTVYPCISLKEKLGNVFDKQLNSIWKSKKRKNLIASLVWKNTLKCGKCLTRNECPHCVGISQQESGNMFSCNTCDQMISECIYELKSQNS